MINFITEFKNKAKNKSLTNADMLALVIYKAIKAKSDKEQALHGLIRKAFTAGNRGAAHRKYPYSAVEYAARGLYDEFKDRKPFPFTLNDENEVKIREGNILGCKKSDILDENDLTLFDSFIKTSIKFAQNDYEKEFA